jgi:hypothetical protein
MYIHCNVKSKFKVLVGFSNILEQFSEGVPTNFELADKYKSGLQRTKNIKRKLYYECFIKPEVTRNSKAKNVMPSLFDHLVFLSNLSTKYNIFCAYGVKGCQCQFAFLPPSLCNLVACEDRNFLILIFKWC